LPAASVRASSQRLAAQVVAQRRQRVAAGRVIAGAVVPADRLEPRQPRELHVGLGRGGQERVVLPPRPAAHLPQRVAAIRLERAVPRAHADVDRPHLEAVALGVADDRRRRCRSPSAAR
jgi:hypothetical protein